MNPSGGSGPRPSPGSAGRPLIICASTQTWDAAWFRKQIFMKRLSAQRPVLYVEPSYSLLRRPEGPVPNPWFGPRVESRGENLWTLLPPRGLPFWTHPWVSRIQYRAWGRMLRREAARLGFTRTWLWIYKPHFIQSVPTLRPERVLFDLVDDLVAYDAGAHSGRTLRACVEQSIATADLVLTTSSLLAETYAARTRRGEMPVVPNGVRAEWINRPAGPEPGDLAGLPHPRLGFVGAVFSYLDYDLLIRTARAFPSGSMIVVGPVHEAQSAARLAREPNVHLLGARPQDAVPEYISAFDVCLSPFRAGAVRRAVNPLKVYEYLARGKPVVSTPLESLAREPIAEQIRFAEGPEAFVAAVRAALAEDGGEGEEARRTAARLGAARREAVRRYTWEALGDEVARILDQAERDWEDPGRA